MWESLDVEKIKQCIRGKGELDKIFPGFIYEVEKRIHRKLDPRYPNLSSWYGPNGRQRMLELHPELTDPIYLDWVCFGIGPYPIEHCHIGVLFSINEWPASYQIGIHTFSYIWESVEKKLKDAWNTMGIPFSYSYQAAFEEHQMNDLPKTFEFACPEMEMERIVNRVDLLYGALHPLF